jgi:tetratricopeptide (TPR) repeat protein
MSDAELPDELYATVKRLCGKGDSLAESGQFEDAIATYNDAWELIPDPRNKWGASTWILAAIGDAAFLGGFKQSAVKALRYALHCPGGLENPFIHLRFGQVLFDQGEHDDAADELARAYMGAGKDIFAKQDRRYLDFLAGRMIL